jgi:cob(I)alamin adenosyltransferase
MTTKNQAIKKALEPIQREMFNKGVEYERKRIKDIIDIWANKLEGIYDINKSDIEKLQQEIEKTEGKDDN